MASAPGYLTGKSGISGTLPAKPFPPSAPLATVYSPETAIPMTGVVDDGYGAFDPQLGKSDDDVKITHPPFMSPPPGQPSSSTSFHPEVNPKSAYPPAMSPPPGQPSNVRMPWTRPPFITLPPGAPPGAPTEVAIHDPYVTVVSPPMSQVPSTSAALPIPPPPPRVEPWQTSILNSPVINLHNPASWPFWFGKAILLPKSKEAVYISSLSTPPPWFVQLIKANATLPSHITSPFVAQGESAASVEYMGAPMEREKLFGIVEDFFKLQFDPMPTDGAIGELDATQLGELKVAVCSILAATQALGPMFAELQEKSVDCLNCVGDYIDAVTETLAKVEQQIKNRALAPLPPLGLQDLRSFPLSLRTYFPGSRIVCLLLLGRIFVKERM